jgi:uncharacterized membrane protein YfcA
MTFSVSAFWLSLFAALAYLIESVFGFGGTLIFITSTSFFVDFKTILYLSIYVSLVASTCIFLYERRAMNWPKLGRILLLSMPGVIIGTALMEVFSTKGLLVVFALLLIAYALQGLIWPHLKIPKALGRGFVVLGGLVQGLYSSGGPFVLMGSRSEFPDKSQLRAVMAGFFISTNIFRIIQNEVQGHHALETIWAHAWLAIPVIAAVQIGHYVHNRISEKAFRKGVLVLILCAGCAMVVKSLL